MKVRFTIFAALTVFASSALAQTQEFRGTVTDSMCGRKHLMKNVSAAQCAMECAKSGSDFALLVGDKLYTLKGDKTRIDKFAGANVVVTGELNGSVLNVKDIKPGM